MKPYLKSLLPVLLLIIAFFTFPACDSAQSHLDAGDSYFNQNNYQKAVEEYSRAVQIASTNATAFTSLGRSYLHLSDFNEAISNFDKALKINPNLARTYYLRALAYSSQNKTDNALADMDKAINLNGDVTREMEPDMANAYFNLGVASKQLGRTVMAQAFLGAAIRENEKMFAAYMERADFYIFNHYYDLAILDYSKAVALKPDSALAFRQRGFAFLQLGQPEVAIHDLGKAITLDSKSAESYIYRGMASLQLQNYEQSQIDLDKAISLDGKSALAYLFRGYLYKATGRNNLAQADFTRGLQTASDSDIIAQLEQAIQELKNLSK
jgi:tetratricopeptide (TPR) repeat protein